jgi:SAM-dependent methyltransferase
MTAELIAFGYRVSGADASAGMLARARRRLGPDVLLHHEALPALTIDGVFDAAVSTLDGLNYLTPAELHSALRALHTRIRPDGWFIFDVHTDAMMAFAAANPTITGESHGMRFAITNAMDVRARVCRSRIAVVRAGDGGAFAEDHVQHFFTESEIRTALIDAGFEVIEVTDEYTHDPVVASTLRATWVARRRMLPAPPS